MCTRPVTRYRSETKYRWVTKPVDVVDGTCGRKFWFAPLQNGSYLVDFTYQDHQSCHVVCLEQHPAADGTFENKPCPDVPPEQQTRRKR
jgi:hypothetical protein